MAPAYSRLPQEEAGAQTEKAFVDAADIPKGSPNRRRRILLHATASFVGAALALGAYCGRSQLRSTPVEHNVSLGEVDNVAQCPAAVPLPASPPAPINPWASLSVQDTTEIYRWLVSDEQGLNLTSALEAELNENSVFHIGAYRPSKSDALAYIADPENVPSPERYARVTIHHGSAAEPYIQDYLIGPLASPSDAPATNGSPGMQMRKLTEIYHRDPIPYHARGISNLNDMRPLAQKTILPLADITEDLFGASARGLPNDTLIAGASAPWSFDGNFRRIWLSWRRNVPGPWLHPLNFFQYIDASGTDPEKWKLLKVVYNHQVFDSIESFVDAYKNGTLKRLPARPDQNKHLDWSSRKRPSELEGADKKAHQDRDLDHLPGPRSVSFAGLRFRVDRKTQYVSWMGWGMYLGFDRDMGLSLWDIRFKDERIIYELAPQEAIAQYAGNDPIQTTSAWLDRYFGMGAAVRDMIPGYDCPYEAVYLPATTYSAAGSATRQKAICIFEQDSGRPLTRHTGYMPGEFGSVRGYILTVRSISTVGNYDYLFDYMFHFDGTIEVRVSASGYLQGGFWEKTQAGYGTAIRDTTMGSLHDHVINFKVDLDVVGTRNSLLQTTTAREEVDQPWFEDDWGNTVIQQKITRKFIENEDEAKLLYPKNLQGGYALVNKEETNQWGIPRGYSVHPGYLPVHNTIAGSKRLLNNANWAHYNLAVTKRKETEPTSSSMWNAHLPAAPMVNFDNFFNGENITQDDLVMWINVGTHHLPQAEDSPNTRTNTAASSFFLTPLNYFDADVSMEARNAILLTAPATPGEAYDYNDYGVQPAYCVPQPVEPFEYSGLKAFGHDGNPLPPAGNEEVRKEAELFHRIKFEL